MNKFCIHCGKKADGSEKFCTNCGKQIVGDVKNETPINTPKEVPITYKPAKARRGPTIPAWIGIVVIVGFVIWGVYSSSQNDTAVSTSNAALTTANSSDTVNSTEQTIQQFKTAFANATDDNTKRTILTNLALVYDSSGDTTDALTTYQQALGYASKGTSDYYLISGEIAQDQVDPATAQSDLLQANQLLPNDYQINNELALFYLDLGNQWTSFDDLPKALQYMKVAYGLQTNDVSTQNLAVIYYYNGDYKQTIDLLLPLNLTNHPNSALYLGYAYAKEKDVKDAEYYFQKAIDLGVQVPQDVNDYLNSNPS